MWQDGMWVTRKSATKKSKKKKRILIINLLLSLQELENCRKIKNEIDQYKKNKQNKDETRH